MLSRRWYWFWATVSRILFALSSQTKVINREAVPLKGPLLIVSNHVSYLDPVLLGAFIPRRTACLAKEELFKILGLGWLLRTWGVMPVKRGFADRTAIRRAEEVLNRGGALLMFPEGTRSRNARLQPGQTGAAFVALRCGAPVLPVGISGTQHVRGVRDVLRRPRITATFGRPIQPPPAEKARMTQAAQEFTQEIMEAIAALLPPEQRGVYGRDRAPEDATVR